MAQRLDHDVRDELYVSLFGKSVTFHNLQPVGDAHQPPPTKHAREIG